MLMRTTKKDKSDSLIQAAGVNENIISRYSFGPVFPASFSRKSPYLDTVSLS